MGEKINISDHSVVIVSDGFGKLKVYMDGRKVTGVTAVSFTSSMDETPELTLSRLTYGDMKGEKIDD